MEQTASEILKKYEDEHEYHFHDSDREFIIKAMVEYKNQHISMYSFLGDEFHEWIELHDFQFNPVSFNGVIKYRWVNETYPHQATTKELYEFFLDYKNNI